jgi:hypothetical protein
MILFLVVSLAIDGFMNQFPLLALLLLVLRSDPRPPLGVVPSSPLFLLQ